jgi:hypothetical protein
MAAGDLLNTIGDGGAELGLADLFPASNAAFSSSRSNSVIHQSSPNHLAELLEKAGEGDFLRAVAEAVLQLLMESDVEGPIGAGRYERSGERTTWRNGYRDRTLDTRLGALRLRIPKLRQGSYFPPFLEARKSSEKALIRSDPGGLDRRCVDPPGRRFGAGDGAIGDQQVAGFQAVQEPAPANAGEIGRAGPCLPRPATRRRMAVSGRSWADHALGHLPVFGHLLDS